MDDMSIVAVSNIALFLPALPFDRIGAVYLVLAVVSVIYHAGQCTHEWPDVDLDDRTVRKLDHVLGYIVLAINSYLFLRGARRSPRIAGLAAVYAAMSAWFYFGDMRKKYAISHALWHITVGVGSVLVRTL